MAEGSQVFIVGLKIRHANDQNTHPSNGSMNHARWDQDGMERPDGTAYAIEFDRGVIIAFHDHIEFRVFRVMVRAGILRDVRQV